MNDNKLNRPCKHFQLDFLVIGFNEVSCLSEGKNGPHSIDRKGYILFGKYLRYNYQEEVEYTKGQTESVNRRRSDNTMAKRKMTDNTMARRQMTD
jgi:hypothetical protein